MNRLKNIKGYIGRNLLMLISCHLLIMVWWSIAYVLELWTKEHIFFSMDIFSRGYQILKGCILPIICYTILFTILRVYGEKVLFKVYKNDTGLHRKGIFLYSVYVGYLILLMLLFSIGQIVFQFGELKKSFGVLTVLSVLFSLVYYGSMRSDKKQIEQWASKVACTEKVVCAYLTSSDFSESNDARTFSGWAGEQETLVKVLPRLNSNIIYETEESIICPYWIYKDYLYDKHIDVDNRLLIVVDGKFMESDDKLIGQIVDEYLQNGQCVFKFNITRTWCCDAINERPVHSFGTTETAIEVLSKRDLYRRIKYFDSMEFKLSYTSEKEKYLKFQYVNNILGTLSEEELDTTATFYYLLKMVEYVWHYRALYALANSDNLNNVFKDKSLQSSMGLWNSLQGKVNIKYTDEEKVNAYRMVKSILSGVPCNAQKVSYREVCDILTQLRNRYVGHGTMAFSVSQELLDAIKILAYEVVALFYNDEGCLLNTSSVVSDGIGYMQIVQGDGDLCQRLLTGYIKGDSDIYEYLDYVSGRITSTADVVYQLDYTEVEVG